MPVSTNDVRRRQLLHGAAEAEGEPGSIARRIEATAGTATAFASGVAEGVAAGVRGFIASTLMVAGGAARLAGDESRVWDGVRADHARAVARGSEAEAHWFGALAGRAGFEAAATALPGVGLTERAGSAARVAGWLEEGAAVASRVARGTDAGTLLAEADVRGRCRSYWTRMSFTRSCPGEWCMR